MAESTAPKKSLRPKSREQGMGLGLRPQTREQVAESEKLREASEAFGDTEFRYDLDPQLSWNPLARLGYDPEAATSLKSSRPTTRIGAQFPKRASQEGIDRTMSKIPSYANNMLGDKVKPGDVVLTSNIANPPVWSHEFTHRGLQEVGALYRKDPELFKEKYGEDAATLISSVDLTKGEDARDKDEYVVELLDDMSTEMSGLYKSMSETRDKVLSSDDKRAAERVASALKKDRAKNQSVEDIEGYTGRTKGIYGILAAAEDVLEEKGEPPLAKQQEPGFFKKIFKRLGFNEGGLAMEKQMKAFFERGGLSDDGMDRDPVSGNEIPPGSTAINVRDDIPAQLSEGEYVVPADVVKYFGVKFFEDLRTRAKQGLTDMEANGRIGGEPIMPEGMGSDISSQNPPAGITMASGGMVTNQMPVQNPYQQQQTMYSTGMAVGGLTTNTESTFDPSQYSTLGGSYFNAGTGPVTIVEYIGPNGEILPIRTQGGKPLDSVPVGFKTRQQKEAEALSNTSVMAPTVATSPTRTEDDYGGLADGEGSKGIDLGAMSYGDLEAAIDGIENNSTLSGMMTNALSNSGIGRMVSALTGKTIAEKALDDYRAELVSRNEFLDSPQQSRARELEKDPQLGLSRGDAIAMGQGLAGDGGGADTFGEDFAAASAHAEANPTGMTTGKGLTPDDVLGNMPGDVTGGKGGSKGGGSSSGGSSSGGSYGGGSDSGMAGVR